MTTAGSASPPAWSRGRPPRRCAGCSPGASPLRGPRRDPHRQRQGLHRALRPPPGRGAVRPDLPGERDLPPPHRRFAHPRRPARSSGSTRACARSSSPIGPSAPSSRPRPSSTPGSATTTPNGPTRGSRWRPGRAIPSRPLSKDAASIPVDPAEDHAGPMGPSPGRLQRRHVRRQPDVLGRQRLQGQLVDVFVDDTVIQVWSKNHLIKTVARTRSAQAHEGLVPAIGLAAPARGRLDDKQLLQGRHQGLGEARRARLSSLASVWRMTCASRASESRCRCQTGARLRGDIRYLRPARDGSSRRSARNRFRQRRAVMDGGRVFSLAASLAFSHLDLLDGDAANAVGDGLV